MVARLTGVLNCCMQLCCLIKVLEAKEVELFEDDEIMVVEFGESLPVGVGVLCIAFNGTLNDKMKGFYRRLVLIPPVFFLFRCCS